MTDNNNRSQDMQGRTVEQSQGSSQGSGHGKEHNSGNSATDREKANEAGRKEGGK